MPILKLLLHSKLVKEEPKNCTTCRFNCEDIYCVVGSYYANKGQKKICYEGELWESNSN